MLGPSRESTSPIGSSPMWRSRTTHHIPTAPNNPLLDSFIINADETTAVISLLQKITSQTSGVGRGPPSRPTDREQGARTSRSGTPDVKIRVVYFLIFPVDEFDRNWEMTAGWEYGTTGTTRSYRNCGDSYCIRIPPPPSLRVCSVYSLLIS